MKEYYTKWRAAVRLRVVNFVKKWAELNFSEVRQDPKVMQGVSGAHVLALFICLCMCA